MKKYLAITFLIIFLAPMPSVFAINVKTKECGTLRGGDEYATYNLPPGWETYIQQKGFLQTEVGTCKCESELDYERCCEEFGFTYIAGNVGEERGILVWTPFALLRIIFSPLTPVILLLLAAFFLLFRKKNDKKL